MSRAPAQLPGAALAALTLVTLASHVVGEEQLPEYNPRRVVPAFPAIKDPALLTADKAGEKVVRDEELVLGVVVGDEARAYPINMLTGPRREIINDDLGGRSIAATW